MNHCWKQSVRGAEAGLSAIFQNGTSQQFKLDDRNLFYIQMLADNELLNSGAQVVDLGAGTSLFGPVLQKMGLQVTMIDSYSERQNAECYKKQYAGDRREREIKAVNLYKQLGVHVIDHDLTKGIPLTDNSVDVVTCFHMIEHFHNSPKPLFREISRILKRKGHLLLAMPNAVNLRKRIWVMFGENNFAPLEEWYELGDPVFFGHVREPVVTDLRHLMEWNKFKVISTPGRNFIGRKSQALSFLPEKLKSGLVVALEGVLAFFPSLCSDIHIVGQKVD